MHDVKCIRFWDHLSDVSGNLGWKSNYQKTFKDTFWENMEYVLLSFSFSNLAEQEKLCTICYRFFWCFLSRLLGYEWGAFWVWSKWEKISILCLSNFYKQTSETFWLQYIHFLLACWKQLLFCMLATGPQLDSLETLIRGRHQIKRTGLLVVSFRGQKKVSNS